MKVTKDRSGSPVKLGSKVRVLKIRPSVIEDLPSKEKTDVLSMQGEVLEVYEVDEWGSAWVKKWWHGKDDRAFSHSIALKPEEMEVVLPK